MANERLRALLLDRRVTPAWLADAVQVDPKTIERWIVGGRVPYIRLHGTPLHNSICRADEQLLVNTHIYGMKASDAPAFHLRKIPGGDLVSTYLESFERVWESATPCEGA
jgi:hypothetical protein